MMSRSKNEKMSSHKKKQKKQVPPSIHLHELSQQRKAVLLGMSAAWMKIEK